MIEEVIYDDLSDPLRQVKISPVVEETGELNSKLKDLKHFKIGFPYVFRHLYKLQDSEHLCDHFFVFQDIKLLNLREEIDSAVFPFEFFRPKNKRNMCEFCDLAFARFALSSKPKELLEIAPRRVFSCKECYEVV